MKNFKEFLNKKNVFIFGFVLILIAGGLFFWLRGEKETKGSPDDYQIIETEQGVFVENKRGGLIVRAPERWRTEKIELREGWIMFYSPETEIKWKQEGVVLLPLEKGCTIDAEVMYRKMDLIQIKSDIRYSLSPLILELIEFENIIINNREALKTIFDTQKVGSGIIVNIPWNDKVYIFNLTFGVNEKEKCIQEFDKFLETVSIQ